MNTGLQRPIALRQTESWCALFNEVNYMIASINLAVVHSTKSLLTCKSSRNFLMHLISEERVGALKSRDGTPGWEKKVKISSVLLVLDPWNRLEVWLNHRKQEDAECLWMMGSRRLLAIYYQLFSPPPWWPIATTYQEQPGIGLTIRYSPAPRSGGYFHKNIQFSLFAEHIGVKFWAGKVSHWEVEEILFQLPLDARSLLFKLLGTNKSSGSLKI